MNLSELNNVMQAIEVECREDYVGLWAIVWHITQAGVKDASKVMDAALTLLSELLSQGKIIAGQFEHHGGQEWDFHVWDRPVLEIVDKIRREWTDLGRPPILGEIAAFGNCFWPTSAV